MTNVEKAEKINQYFTNVAAKLSSILPDIDMDLLNLEMHLPIFHFHEISMQDISDAIARLSNSQASNDDGITTFKLKCARTELLQPLHQTSYIIHLAVRLQDGRGAEVT